MPPTPLASERDRSVANDPGYLALIEQQHEENMTQLRHINNAKAKLSRKHAKEQQEYKYNFHSKFQQQELQDNSRQAAASRTPSKTFSIPSRAKTPAQVIEITSSDDDKPLCKVWKAAQEKRLALADTSKVKAVKKAAEKARVEKISSATIALGDNIAGGTASRRESLIAATAPSPTPLLSDSPTQIRRSDYREQQFNRSTILSDPTKLTAGNEHLILKQQEGLYVHNVLGNERSNGWATGLGDAFNRTATSGSAHGKTPVVVTGSSLSPNPFNQGSTTRLSNQGYIAGSFVQTPQVPGINRKRQHAFDLSDSDNEISSPTPKPKPKANPQRKSDPASLLGAPRPIKRNRHGMMVLEPDPALPHTPPRPSACSIPSTPPRPMPKRTFTGLPPVSSAGESPSRAAKARAEERIKEHFTLDAEWMEKSEEERAREFGRTSGGDGSDVVYGREQFLRDRMMGDRWVARNGMGAVERRGVVDGEGVEVVGDDEGSEFEI